MTQQSIPHGSFGIAKNFHRTEWLRGGGFALVMLAFGAFCVVYGAYVARDLLEVSRIWKEGHDSPVEAAYGGKVTTHNFVLKDYELDVSFLTEEALENEGEPLHFKASFHRFFTGPDEGESMTVKYLPEDPQKAVTSWQHEGLMHGWIWAGLMWAIGATCLFAAVMMVRATLALTGLVDSLMREGQLILADVLEAKAGGASNNPMLTLHYKTARNDEPQKQTFHLKRGSPLFANEQQVVVLSSIDQKQTHALREDGYPLSAVPDLTLLGIEPAVVSEPDNDTQTDDEDSQVQAG